MKYEYDSSGVYFSYFLLTALSLWLIPQTYFYLRSSKPRQSFQGHVCACETCVEKLQWQTLQKKRTLKNPQISRTFVLWVVGWVVLLFLAKFIFTTEIIGPDLWDPYKVLGIPTGAELKDVRKSYRKLSLIWHPDKAVNKTDANDKFVAIAKAYRALTDEETRKNWEEFGDPDGRQPISYGIALPSWVVDPKFYGWVLGVYALIFGIMLPVAVGRWWRKSIKYTKDHVQNQSMALYFQEIKEAFNCRRVLELLSASAEFNDELKWRGTQDETSVGKLLRTVRLEVFSRTGEKLETPKRYNAPYCQKALAILYAHLFRVPIEDASLLEDSKFIITKSHHLVLKGIMQVASANFWLSASLNCVDLAAMLVQATPSVLGGKHETSDLFQLPHITFESVKALRMRKKCIKSISQLMQVPLQERIEIISSLGFDETQCNNILSVACERPELGFKSAEFKCLGEELIVPGCLVTFIVKLEATNSEGESLAHGVPTVTSSSNETPKDLAGPALTDLAESDDEDELLDNGDGEGKHIKVSRLTRLISGTYWMNPNRPVHCPYFSAVDFEGSGAKRASYCLFFAGKNDRIVGVPLHINNLVPRSPYLKNGATGIRTLKIQFQAPPQPGTYQFQVVLQCDSYIGLMVKQDVKLVVKMLPRETEQTRAASDLNAWQDFDKDENEDRELIESLQQANIWIPNNASRPPPEFSDSSSESDGFESSDEE